MSEVIAVRLDGSEGDTAQTVDFQNALRSTAVCDDHDIGFLSNANLVTNGVNNLCLLVRIERQVVETTVGKSVTIVCKKL